MKKEFRRKMEEADLVKRLMKEDLERTKTLHCPKSKELYSYDASSYEWN
jgi:hypothetical protein